MQHILCANRYCSGKKKHSVSVLLTAIGTHFSQMIHLLQTSPSALEHLFFPLFFLFHNPIEIPGHALISAYPG